MTKEEFIREVRGKYTQYNTLIYRENQKYEGSEEGFFEHYQHPVLEYWHTPIHWRYDLDYRKNPSLAQHEGLQIHFRPSIFWFENKCYILVRFQDQHKKSFYAIAESPNGLDCFEFWNYPMALYDKVVATESDLHLVNHQDGYVYGIYHRRQASPEEGHLGIIRSRDLKSWEHLPDVTLHHTPWQEWGLYPAFVQDQYVFYTYCSQNTGDWRRVHAFSFAFCEDIEVGAIQKFVSSNHSKSTTGVLLVKSQNLSPMATDWGWLHGIVTSLHRTQPGAIGIDFFITATDEPSRVLHSPTRYVFDSPHAAFSEDTNLSQAVFGWACNKKGELFIYYGNDHKALWVSSCQVRELLNFIKENSGSSSRTHFSFQVNPVNQELYPTSTISKRAAQNLVI